MDNRSLLKSFLLTEPAQTEFLPWLTARDISRFARTNKSIHRLFQDTLMVERLAHYIIVEPNVVKVIEMVRANRELLNTNIPKVVNRKGQLIRNNKPFSLAFGAGDDEMCAAVKEEMIRFYGSEATEAEIQKQISEKIGTENKEQDDQIKNQLNALLGSVVQAITNEQFNLGRDADNKLKLSPATLVAITAFREGLAALQSKIIDKGMHFRLNTLQETYDAYVQAAEQWGYEYLSCSLFEDSALSSVLAYLPENDAQRGSQGLHFLQQVNRPETFARSLKLRGTDIDFYDYLRAASPMFSGLSGFFVDIVRGGYSVWDPRPVNDRGRSACQNLCRTKTSNLQSLCSRNDRRSAATRCVIL